MIAPHKINRIAEKYADKNIKFMSFLKNRADSDELDQQFRDLHNKIFIRDKYNCCKCANCCKLYDICFEYDDISAIAKYLGQADSDFIEMYLKKDEETNVFLVREKPCSFLDADGKCRIYEFRPSVCRGFPHTNKPNRLFSLLGVIRFADNCPVVFEILEQLKQIYNFR